MYAGPPGISPSTLSLPGALRSWHRLTVLFSRTTHVPAFESSAYGAPAPYLGTHMNNRQKTVIFNMRVHQDSNL